MSHVLDRDTDFIASFFVFPPPANPSLAGTQQSFCLFIQVLATWSHANKLYRKPDIFFSLKGPN